MKPTCDATPGLMPGPARDALCAAVAALDAAERDAGSPAVWCQTLAQVGRCYRGLGAAVHAEGYLLQALRWARVSGSPDLVVDLLCELAEVAVEHAEAGDDDGSRLRHTALERARDRGFEASRLAARSSDPQREITVLLRVSDVLEHCGDRDDAIALQCRALGLISAQSATA